MTPSHLFSARPAVPRRTALLITAGLALVVLLADAAAASAVAFATSSTHASAAASAAAPSRWVWPLSPRPEIVRRFDPPDAPWGRGHRGVDLLGSDGQPVRAAGAGVVTYAGLLAGRGMVTVRHGDLRTTYQPVTPEVSVGAHVDAGTEVGLLRTAGGHCAPRTCLHWGLLRGDDYLDPLSLLGTGPPRLLPLDGHRSTEAVAPALRPHRAGRGDRRDLGPASAAPTTTATLVAGPSGPSASSSSSGPAAASLLTNVRWTPFTLPPPSAIRPAANSPSVPSPPDEPARRGESAPGTGATRPKYVRGAEFSPAAIPMALSSLATPSPRADDTAGQDRRLGASRTGMPTLLTTVMAPAAGALAGAVAAGLLVRRSGAPMVRPPLPPRPPSAPPAPAFGSALGPAPSRRRRPAPVVDLASMRRRSGRAA
ncbi:M23 family metallopeptidase [Actinopolymorpha sp. NPDC004070]|uniref:murein hydrolase activator EnvC family protein n=1 Tax=Actinopolymorpha sp. NPDC004070 TaxID=3154548 RepID=UPI0033B4BF77